MSKVRPNRTSGMSTKNALVFVTQPTNKNSIAVLAGVVEGREDLALSLLFLRDDPSLHIRLQECLHEYERVVIAFSFCTPAAGHVAHLVGQLRALAAESHCPVFWVAGGPHPSGAPEATLRMGFDVVVVGEAEETFPALLRHLIDGRDYSQVKGLAFLRDGELIRTGRAPPVIPLDNYPPFAPLHRRFGPIEITRGCPFACRFCQTSFLFGGQPRHRSPEVVAEWARVAQSHGIPFMRFVAPNALSYGSPDGREINLAAVKTLLTKVGAVMGRERVYLGSFPSEVRPETVTHEAIRLIKRLAGNRNISIGAQSGSQRILDAMHRGHTVDDVHRACHIVLHHGLLPNVDIIFGMPGETETDRQLTIRMIESLAKVGAVVRTHVFVPLAGTPLAGAAPGTIDAQTDSLLGRLARVGQQHGARAKMRLCCRGTSDSERRG
ncbi:MAG: TIGR04013 family B12-binding domain/radical SAM domain-containing protein, partial [Anaerolineales bacterium]